jgi:hypothetical protein
MCKGPAATVALWTQEERAARCGGPETPEGLQVDIPLHKLLVVEVLTSLHAIWEHCLLQGIYCCVVYVLVDVPLTDIAEHWVEQMQLSFLCQMA